MPLDVALTTALRNISWFSRQMLRSKTKLDPDVNCKRAAGSTSLLSLRLEPVEISHSTALGEFAAR